MSRASRQDTPTKKNTIDEDAVKQIDDPSTNPDWELSLEDEYQDDDFHIYFPFAAQLLHTIDQLEEKILFEIGYVQEAEENLENFRISSLGKVNNMNHQIEDVKANIEGFKETKTILLDKYMFLTGETTVKTPKKKQ